MGTGRRVGAAVYAPIKRAVDVILSAVAIVVLAPVMAVVAVAIKLDSRGPALFRQTRLGRGGTPFTMYKFRSMTVGAEAGGVYVTENDIRVTRVGAFIRRTSLDELPQLVNILVGDMSIIGPRPTLVYHPWPFAEYTPEQRRRFDVRPGLTGWAQVNGRKTVDWDRRLEYDVHYVDHMSLPFDVRILVATFTSVATGGGNINTGATANSPDADDTDADDTDADDTTGEGGPT